MKIVENRKKFFAISLLIMIAGLAAMLIYSQKDGSALNFDVEFAGGSTMEVDIGQDYTAIDIAQIVEISTGQESPQIQSVIGSDTVVIKTKEITDEQRASLQEALKEKYPNVEELSYSTVSGTISGEMQRKALSAILVVCVVMLLYISVRFRDVKAGGSAIISLVHDVLIVLSAYAIFRVPVNNSFVAALLTILGYSINATIVIFDRVRENKKKFRKGQEEELLNKSIMQTMNRSLYTSLTTLLTIGCIYIFGVQSIKEFAMPLIIGIISGTYSSVFLSGSIWYTFMKKGK